MTTLTATDRYTATAVALMIEFSNRGIQLQADGDELRVAPRAALTSTDRAALREHRDSLLALLRREQNVDAADASTQTKGSTEPPADSETILVQGLDHSDESPPTTLFQNGPTAPIRVTNRTDQSLVAKLGKTTWYGYGPLSPIDDGWEALPTVTSWLANEDVSYRQFPLPEEEDDLGILTQRRGLWTWARAMAREMGWEGDFNGPPRVMSLPVPGAMLCLRPGFVFKEDNNGSTFVISPVPMPWLAQGERHGLLH